MGRQTNNATYNGGSIVDDWKLSEYVRENFDMRPAAIIEQLDLKRPIYKNTAAYGHYGRSDESIFTWERTDRAAKIKSDLL